MTRILLIVFLILSTVFTACSKKEAASKVERAAIYFEALPADSTGIHFSNTLIHQDDLNIIEFLYYYNGGGVALGDINNDGLDDIYLTANQGSDKLYLNLGNMKFKDITDTAQIANPTRSANLFHFHWLPMLFLIPIKAIIIAKWL